MTSSNGSARFKVVLAANVKQRADQLHDIAVGHGLGDQFIEALLAIERGLRHDPRHFGDPLYRLPALKMTVYLRAVFPIAVDFGVHDLLPFVVVRGFRLMI